MHTFYYSGTKRGNAGLLSRSKYGSFYAPKTSKMGRSSFPTRRSLARIKGKLIRQKALSIADLMFCGYLLYHQTEGFTYLKRFESGEKGEGSSVNDRFKRSTHDQSSLLSEIISLKLQQKYN